MKLLVRHGPPPHITDSDNACRIASQCVTSVPLTKLAGQAGRLRAIAVTSGRPAAVLPGVPTVAENYPGFELVTWMGIFLPAGTPETIRARLEREFIRVVQMNEVRDRLGALGNDIVAGKGSDLSAHVERELKLYASIIKSAGIKPQ
ncbi:MAG: Bug family tripartite tricarboxylate transporter substrate binding protein [Burkholderiales bacterium]